MATQELTREAILERVKEVLAKPLAVSEEKIVMGASFKEDLGADSLDALELVMELEDQFGIKIPEDDARKIATVGQAVDYVFGHQSQAA